jgi:citrate synthase
MTEEKAGLAVRGLEGVIASETRIGYVDGVNGKLYYAGYDIDVLAVKAGYEEVVFLLWNDRLPTKKELADFRKQLVSEISLPKSLLQWLKRVPRNTHPMVLLRSAVSDLALYDEEAEDNSPEANRRKAIRLVAKLPTIIAAFHRFQQKKDLLAPDPRKGIAENFLRMFLGRKISKGEAEAIELMFVLHADHGFNASTFAARVTASTLADIYGAITSAIATLQGRLHGGANQRVMEMLSDIGTLEDAEEYVDSLLARQERIMGFGHRVYKVEDPRAKFLRKASRKLCEAEGQCKYLEMNHIIEKKVKKEKGIYPNVDFYSATVQHYLGIPVKFYTTLFAASRIAGWSAHVLEQHADNRLMRPRSQFIGKYPREFVPISKRK